jgi:VWFA-related protein
MLTTPRFRSLLCGAGLAVGLVASISGQQPATPGTGQEPPFRFKSGVELINVTATVVDRNGRFVPNLRQEDFLVYEDGVMQTVTYFNADRVPVSLGIVLDNSGSMAGDKIEAARGALDRFAFDLLGRDDELFLYLFNDQGIMLQDWTTDRSRLSRALGRIVPNGGTAMYDALAESVPHASMGRHQKRAIVLISDGNDTSSFHTVRDVKEMVRSSEVLVYAVGIDGDSQQVPRVPSTRPPPRLPFPIPPTFPGPRIPGRRGWLPNAGQIFGPQTWQNDDRVNVSALRQITDDSGGRTEIVRSARDLDPATTSIADELSRQYYLGYTSSLNRDGRWHTIRVELKDRDYRVRARTGYMAN